eukprot:GDKI01001769.1.p3 GENE.GDKI01001769.1~~GDKI01001769.1.p3  ORF type:complete len:139 (+),score=53.20 GDKI01001769.1:778-1194(+)
MDGTPYTSRLELLYDASLAALGKLGFGDIHVAVGETGWPTDGGMDTVCANAAVYLRNFARTVERGTPKFNNTQQGRRIAMFYFQSFNEPNKDGLPVEPHFGLFFENGKRKFEWGFGGDGGVSGGSERKEVGERSVVVM